MRHVLLSGASGFLGSHLLEALLEQGYQVSILKRSTSNTWRINHLLGKVSSFNVDVTPLEDAFKGRRIDAVIHTACSYGRSNEAIHEIAECNLLFSLRLLDAAVFYKTTTFFNTDTLLPKNLNPYSLSKKQFVEWLKQRSHKIQVINLKLEHMYGPKDDRTKFVPWLISQLEQNVARIPLTEGDQLRDFTYIDDIVSAYLTLLEKSEQLLSLAEFDVGTGKLISVRDFVTAIYKKYKQKVPVNQTVLGFGDVPLRDGEQIHLEMNVTKINSYGWQAVESIESGIDRTLNAQLVN